MKTCKSFDISRRPVDSYTQYRKRVWSSVNDLFLNVFSYFEYMLKHT